MEHENGEYTIEEALGAVGFGKFQGLILVYAGFGWLSEAMEVMILSFLGPAVKLEWALSSSEESLLSTVVFAGMLIGAYSWGLVSDNFGRRKAFFGITMITCGAGFLRAFSPNYTCLLMFNCLAGMGLGGGHVFLSWFLEFTPTPQRGMWMVIFSMFWTIGAVSEASLAWIVMPRLNWRWLLVFSAIPSFLLLLFYGLAPESPRFLCLKGRTTDACQVLERVALLNRKELPPGILVSPGTTPMADESSSSEHRLLPPSTTKKSLDFKTGFSSFFMLFSPKIRLTTFLLWLLFFGNTFSYYGIVLMTSELSQGQSSCSSTILQIRNIQDNSLYADVLLTTFAEVPGLILSAVIVDRFGRKLSMAVLFILAWIFLFPLVFHQSTTITTGLLFGARMCSVGTFTVACVYAPEAYPTAMRSTGAGIANAVGRIGGMICPLVAVALVTDCHVKSAIILFEVVIVVSVISILLLPFETNGRELIDSLPASDSKQPLIQT